jgi:hypothetical protein
MRILALYDVHGNDDALAAVLADPRAADPDAVVVGGDTVPGRSPWRHSRGSTRSRCPSTTSGATASARWPRPPPATRSTRPRRSRRRRSGRSGRRALGEQAADCHARRRPVLPRDPAQRREILTRLSTPDRWTEAFGGVEERLVRRGHTHQQDDRRVGDVRWSTPGASGCPTRATARPGGCGSSTASRTCARRRTTPRQPGGACSTPGWPDDRSVGAALLEPIEPDVITRLFEERATA